jgi:chaperone required for assembly of F1-ATPase
MTSTPTLAGNPGASFPKRFYTSASVGAEADGFALLLDGRPARTPNRRPVLLPTAAAAQALADEWGAVASVIDPRTMPLTRLVNSVVDGVNDTQTAVLEEIRRYAGSDLLLYRAPEPAELAATQGRTWDPILAWARDDLGVALMVGQGITFVTQPPAALEAFGHALSRDVGEGSAAPFRLGALHVMTTLTGSAVLALAVATGRLTPQDAWSAAHVDEDHQIALWGMDQEAADRRDKRWIEMHTAATLHRLTQPNR